MLIELLAKVPSSALVIHSEALSQMARANTSSAPIEVDDEQRAFEDFVETMML